MITFPNAKINLGLNVVEKRPDGYHNLETVFYPIPLQDALEVQIRNDKPAGTDCTDNPECSNRAIPKDSVTTTNIHTDYTLKVAGNHIDCDPEKNLVIKAYRLLQQQHEIPPLDIHMFKHIPSGAGLGGGSSDAAFMLKLLNEKFQLNHSMEELEKMAATLGADCAFFIQNEPTYATGIGNVFTPISLSLRGYYIILVKPEIGISTKEAYAGIRPHHPEKNILDIIKQPVTTWRDTLINDFEDCVFPNHPELAFIKDQLYDMGALYAAMSGSGSALFGIFPKAVEDPEKYFRGHFCRQRELTV